MNPLLRAVLISTYSMKFNTLSNLPVIDDAI